MRDKETERETKILSGKITNSRRPLVLVMGIVPDKQIPLQRKSIC